MSLDLFSEYLRTIDHLNLKSLMFTRFQILIFKFRILEILNFLPCIIQILTELEHSGVGRNKEQAARMLGHLVANAARLIRPYMDPILKV